MSETTTAGRKPYDGRVPGEPFRVVKKCQECASSIFIYTAKAEKEYRQTLCKVLQGYATEMIHSARLANNINIHDPKRQEVHAATLEYIDRINDLLPVVRRCKCISINQEKELYKLIGNLRFGYKKWIESDLKRLKSEAPKSDAAQNDIEETE